MQFTYGQQLSENLCVNSGPAGERRGSALYGKFYLQTGSDTGGCKHRARKNEFFSSKFNLSYLGN